MRRTARALGLRVVTLALSVALASSGAVSLAACTHAHHAHHAPSDHSCPACVAAHPPGVVEAPPTIGSARLVPVGRVHPPAAPDFVGICCRELVSPRGPPWTRPVTNAQFG